MQGQGVFGITYTLGPEQSEDERSHVYAAQFALSHAGISYPLWIAGIGLPFMVAWACLGLMLITMIP